MSIPGEQRSPYPDDASYRAGVFVAAIRDDDMEQAWAMLSKETRGMRFGVWATRQHIDMQISATWVSRPPVTWTIPMRLPSSPLERQPMRPGLSIVASWPA